MTQRKRTIAWQDPGIGLHALPEMTGLEYLRAIINGRLPQPPIGATMRMSLVDAGRGTATFECEPDESLYNPIGAVHGGFMCTVLDSAIGCAAHSVLECGQGYTSIELKVNYLRPVTRDSGLLRCTGSVSKAGRRVIFAEAVLADSSQTPLATASGSLLAFPIATSVNDKSVR